MKKGDNVRLRSDGRYEARYAKSRDEKGKIIYGCCYGKTLEEAVEKREYQLRKLAKNREMNLLILGAGIHGIDVHEIAKSLHVFNKISFLDDDPSKPNVIGKWKDAGKYIETYPHAIVAVGDEGARKTWTEQLQALGFIVPTLVHPTAFISDGVEIGLGSVICARATISSGVTTGKGCIITTGSRVPMKTHIPDWCYFDFDKIIHYRENNTIETTED